MCFVGLIFSLATSDLIGNYGFKKTFARPRPAETAGVVAIVRSNFGGYSFVSNHSTNMFNFATYTTAIVPAAALPVFGIAVLVAYSRVYNGVHFPSDILVGAILGALIGYVFSKLALKICARVQAKTSEEK